MRADGAGRSLPESRTEAYRKAEQQIAAARQEGATTLDLSYLRLTEVPTAIAALTQLQGLDLSGNQLTELPEAISSLTQLQRLDISTNQLTELPAEIAVSGGNRYWVSSSHRVGCVGSALQQEPISTSIGGNRV